MKFIVRIICFSFISSLVFSQTLTDATFPRDTFYTLNSAYNKYVKEYPFIKKAPYNKDESTLAYKGVTYSTIGSRNLVLDMFKPFCPPDTLYSAVLLVHGGGWRSGDRSLLYPLADQLARHGIVTIPVEYRLSPEALYPAAIIDINNALHYIRKNADKYAIDTNQIAILGSSAGAQIAGLIATKFGWENNTRLIRAFVNIDGIMEFISEDVRQYEDDPNKKVSSAGKWFGGRYNEKKYLWHEASPLVYVNEKSPPMLFVNSSKPRFHCGRDDVIKILTSNNIYSEVHTLDGSPHSFWLFEPWFTPTTRYIANFLKKVMK